MSQQNNSEHPPSILPNRPVADYRAIAHRGVERAARRTNYSERVVDALVERVAQVLCAQVLVLNERGQIVASSQPHLAGLPLDVLEENFLRGSLRFLLALDEQQALRNEEILIGDFQGEAVSLHLAQQVTQLVLDQLVLAERLPNRHDFKNKFVHDLLNGLLTDDETIALHAKNLGVDLRLPRAVLLVDAADYILGPPATAANEWADQRPDKQLDKRAEWYNVNPDLLRRRVQFVIHRIVGFFHLPNDTICAHIGEGQVAILKASDNLSLTPWTNNSDLSFSASAQSEPATGEAWANLVALKRAAIDLLAYFAQDSEAVQIGLGRHYPGVHGLRRSYEDARVALSLGSRFHRSRGVHSLSDLGVAAFVGLADERTKVDLAVHLLSPLDHEHELLGTLVAFFAHDCAASPTAKSLSIHRNTLSYRLDKITSLTGLDPRRFDDAVQIRLALLLRELHADPIA